jgi:rhodanese-related sulfurtransferase
LRLRALGTPGHRPEHLSFTVIDATRGADPWMVLTGDSLLVGDLARPDLAVEAVDGARTMHGSMRQLLALGDHVEVWPAHVGGSLCGGAGLSGKTSSTIGFERIHSPLLRADQDAFVAGLVRSIPTRPPNVSRIVALNSAESSRGPEKLGLINSELLRTALRDGATVLDGRDPAEFDRCHLAGAINLPLASPGVGTRAGWALLAEDKIVISATDPDQATSMASFLHAVGLWNTLGFTVVDRWAWERQDLPVATADAWDIEQLAGSIRARSVDLVDVRDDHEWQSGHVAGSHHLPLKAIRVNQPDPIPTSELTTAVACAAGARAAFAASILRRAGRRDVVRVSGGGVPNLGAHGIGLEIGD